MEYILALYLVPALISLTSLSKLDSEGMEYLKPQALVASFTPIVNIIMACARIEGWVKKLWR